MERVTPIHVLEYEFRRKGVFVLVGARRRELWFYGYKPTEIKQMIDSIRGRSEEMVKFLIARASVRGETK